MSHDHFFVTKSAIIATKLLQQYSEKSYDFCKSIEQGSQQTLNLVGKQK